MADKPNLKKGFTQDSEIRKKAEGNVQRQAITVTPQTIISQPTPKSGYQNPTGTTNNSSSVKTAKEQKVTVKPDAGSNTSSAGLGGAKIQTNQSVTKTSDIQKQAEERVQRKHITATPQTIISQPTPKSSYQNPTGTTNNSSSVKTAKEQKITARPDGETNTSSAGLGGAKIQTNQSVIKTSDIQKQAEERVQRKPITATPQTIISRPAIKVGYTTNSINKEMKKKEEYNKITHREEDTNTKQSSVSRKTSAEQIQPKRQVSINAISRTTISRPKSIKISSAEKKGLQKAKILAQNSLNAQNDTGASAVSYALSGTMGAVKVIKASQKASDIIIKKAPEAINTGVKVVKTGATGIYKVGNETIKVVKTIDSTVGMIKTGAIPLDRVTVERLKNFAINKIANSKIAERITFGIQGIKTSVATGIGNIKSGISTAKQYVVKVGKGAVKTAILAKGVVYGTVSIKISKETLSKIGKKAIPIIGKGIKIGGKSVGYTLKTGVKGVYKGSVQLGKTGIKLGKGTLRGANIVGDVFVNSNSFEAQTMGYGLKSIHYTVKGIGYTPKVAKAGYKGIKTSVQTVYKGGKFIVNTGVGTYRYIKTGIKVARKVGTKQALKMYSKRWARSLGGKSINLLRKAGGSVVNAVLELVKKIGAKVLLPLLLIVVGIGAVSTLIDGVAGLIVSIFSPFVSDDSGNEVDEIAWLTSKITTSRNELIQDVKDVYNDNLVSNGGEYHYVRFFNAIENVEIELTDINIANNIYSVSEYLENIEPIFHTIMLSEYELEASESQMKDLFNEIWDCLSVVTTEQLPIEYCHMTKVDNADGTYTIEPIKEVDDNVHADIYGSETLLPCPNYSGEYTHTANAELTTPTCSCDYYYWLCLGHKGNLNCGTDAHYHGDGYCIYCKDGLDEHEHTSSCCSKEYHPICSYANCGFYLGDACYKWHDHTFNCNDDNCDKTEHSHGSGCCTRTEHSHDDWESPTSAGCYATSYCSTGEMTSECTNSSKNFKCNGYYTCDGHKILKLTVELKSFGELLDKYFLDEIAQLESKATLTADETTRLNELHDYYEICLEYAEILATEYGVGGGTIVSLEGVTLTEVTDYACSFIGNPYVWGGTDPNTGADCSGFVQYVYAHFGVSLPRVSRDQVKSGITIASIEQAQPGDLIFWSDNGTDSGVYHVAIYLGNNLLVHASNSAPYPAGGIKVSNVYGTIYKIKRVVE